MTRLIAIFITLALAPSVALAGTVNGRVALPKPEETAPSPNLYGKYAHSGHEGHEAHGSGASVAVVALLGAAPANAPIAPVPTVDQNGLAFHPNVVAVQRGTQVRFLNSDPVFHNVFSLSPVKKFDLGRYPKGKSKLLKFEEAGVVKYFCDIHPEMTGVVVVVETPYFIVTDETGGYQIDDIPPGRYRVAVWHEGLAKLTEMGSVQVPEDGSIEFIAGSSP